MTRQRPVVAQLEPAPEPLFNLEAEAALLGALLIENSLVGQLGSIVAVEDFGEPLHARLYDAIQCRVAQGKAVTIALLAPQFRDDPAIRDLGGINYLAELTADGQGLLVARDLAEQIHDLACRRRARETLKSGLQAVADLEVDPHATLGAVRDALAATPAAKQLPLLDLSAWANREPPPRHWALFEWIPARQATYLTGPGSAGKSLLAQQLCTCMGLGLPFLGIETRSAGALYITCEDEPDELERRQKAICETLGIDRSELAGRLHLVSLAGALGNELARFDGTGAMIATEAYRRLETTAVQTGASFVALDNVAHLFAGNENERGEVAAFVNLLNRLAQAINGAVLFLGHPNKAGGPFSGSTAWENQVRSRLYLETPSDDEGGTPDPDARLLSRQKSNYARNGERLGFRWHKWAYVRGEDLPADYAAELATSIRAAGENDAFLACLRARAEQGEARAVGPAPGPNYAPAQFEGMAQAKGLKKAALKRAMDRLFSIRKIETHTYRNKAKSRDVTVIREVPEGTPNAFPNASRTLFPNAPELSPEHPRTHTVGTSYPLGAALGAAAPGKGRS